MWGSSALLYSPERPRASPLSPSDRKQRKNHTSKLQELALLLPVALRIGTKKLTKKEILLHVLHYIHFLQRSIDVAKALLKIYTVNEDSALGGGGGLAWNSAAGPARRRRSTPSSTPHSRKSHLKGACQKPQKKRPRESERQSRAQSPRRYLALVKPKKQVAPYPEQPGGNALRASTSLNCSDSYGLPQAASPLPPGHRKGGRSWLALLDVAENSVSGCGKRAPPGGPYCALEDQHGVQRLQFLNRTQPFPRQKLVFYDSSEEVEEAPDADPWLPAWNTEDSPQGSPLALGPPKIDNWSVTGHPSEILGLSPSLFSSPGKMLPEQILEDDAEYLTQALFEEVLLEPVAPHLACKLEEEEEQQQQQKDTPSEAPEDALGPLGLCPSSVSLDHCYLLLSESSKAPTSGSSADSDHESDAPADPKGPLSSSDDGDYTWTPTRRASTLPAVGRKGRKGRKGRGPVKPKESKEAPGPTAMKKKCVNGFIMFCRMNRKQYIRACPGTASTAATKELAQLWRVMTQQERRPYCVKARRFSRQHNRIVKQESSSSEDEDWDTPKPFYQLLAEKARNSPEPAFPPPAPQD